MNLNVIVHPLGPLNESMDLFVMVDISELFPPSASASASTHFIELIVKQCFCFSFPFFLERFLVRCVYKIRQWSKNILFIANHVKVTYRFSEFFHAINYKLSPLSVRKRLIF